VPQCPHTAELNTSSRSCEAIPAEQMRRETGASLKVSRSTSGTEYSRAFYPS
jgi:hypothetical protein